jgi:hypothetical protein
LILALGGADSKGLLGFGEPCDFPKPLILNGLTGWLGFGVENFAVFGCRQPLAWPDLG